MPIRQMVRVTTKPYCGEALYKAIIPFLTGEAIKNGTLLTDCHNKVKGFKRKTYEFVSQKDSFFKINK